MTMRELSPDELSIVGGRSISPPPPRRPTLIETFFNDV
jgi:hypothetical protein